MNTPGLLSFLALALAAAPAFAQSMQVLSSGQEARRCSDAAQMASTIGGASRADLEDCNRALVTVALRQRDRAATLVNRGILESALGDQDAAMASYDKALVVMPELPEPWVGRGNVLFLRGDAAGAITASSPTATDATSRVRRRDPRRDLAWKGGRVRHSSVADNHQRTTISIITSTRPGTL
jgi:tetratricopeptide (TPR) repeat protein